MPRLFGRGEGKRKPVIRGSVEAGARTSVGVLAALALASVGLAAVALFAHSVLSSALGGVPPTSGVVLLDVATVVFLVAVLAVVVVQSMRASQRVAGPEYRLVQSLRRIRAGDLSFRVHLRRGDLLGGLAEECNALLDYLNANPPEGAQTGTDVVEIASLETEFAEVSS
jgi:HAMP domain-containing protein